MKPPKISVVIPTYNRSEKLKDAIKSIEKADYTNNEIEIVIVDDCSIDNTTNVVKDLGRDHPNIKYFKTKENSGPATARNIGIKNSKGKYVFFTDDDCIVSKDLFEKYISFLEKNPKVVGAGGYLIPSSKNIFAKTELLKDKILKIDDKSIKIGKNLPVGFTSNVIYQKKVLDEFEGFDEKIKIPAGEDLKLKRIICEKYDMASLPTIVYHNHDYNLDYILSIILKQGLGKFPSKNKYKKIFMIFRNLPFLIYNILKKTLDYRRKE